MSDVIPTNRKEALDLMLKQGGYDSLSPEQRAAVEANWKYFPPASEPVPKPKGYPGICASEGGDPAPEPELSEGQRILKLTLLRLAADIRKSTDPEKLLDLESMVQHLNRQDPNAFEYDQVSEMLREGDAEEMIEKDDAERKARQDRNIVITGHDLHHLTERAIRALKNWNQPPRLFHRAGGIVRITLDESGRPVIDRADEFTVRWALEESADWMRETKNDIVPVYPPLDVVRNLMREPALSLPPLKGTIEIPTLRGDGSIVLKPGYDERTGLYYAPDPNLKIPEVPDRPTKREVRKAVELLREIFCDFPFIDDASRTNTIATLITPILRPMVHGPVPLALFDKPAAGTGSSLLAEVVALIVTGRDAAMMTAPTHEDEWEKKIASVLIAGRSVAVIDNVDVRLKVASLASLLTLSTYEGRILGKSEMITLPHRTVWMAAGINLQLGGDMPRRCYWVRMDANSSRPWKRTGFKHPELKDWVIENRGSILWSILIICRSWVRAGAPLPEGIPCMGNFEAWSRAVGGILQHCEVAGFLANLDEMYEETDSEGPEWEAFFERWFEIWKDKPITVSTIVDYLKNVDHRVPTEAQLLSVLPDALTEAWGRPGSFTRKLGYELAHRNGQVFNNGMRLKKGGTKKRYMTWIVKGASQ